MNAIGELMRRFGQPVVLFRPGEEEGVPLFAFLQALAGGDRSVQSLPTAVGLLRQDRFLYLGPPEVSLADMEGGQLAFGDQYFELVQAQPIYVGTTLSHWRATLRPVEKGAWH